ncbi:hypothetical protein [Rhizobium grahamii]|uniref:hypothetical protein n=1 Tax=Rhizobium grahamii TaxID=1120045 RepID=UPI0031454A3B
MVVAEVCGMVVGLLVDRVSDIMTIAATNLQPVPGIAVPDSCASPTVSLGNRTDYLLSESREDVRFRHRDDDGRLSWAALRPAVAPAIESGERSDSHISVYLTCCRYGYVCHE